MNQMDLTQIGLHWICGYSGAVLDARSLMSITEDPEAGHEFDRLD